MHFLVLAFFPSVPFLEYLFFLHSSATACAYGSGTFLQEVSEFSNLFALFVFSHISAMLLDVRLPSHPNRRSWMPWRSQNAQCFLPMIVLMLTLSTSGVYSSDVNIRQQEVSVYSRHNFWAGSYLQLTTALHSKYWVNPLIQHMWGCWLLNWGDAVSAQEGTVSSCESSSEICYDYWWETWWYLRNYNEFLCFLVFF